MEDTVKSILRGQTVVTVDTTNYSVVVETIPCNPESPFEEDSITSDKPLVGESELTSNASYLLKLFSNVLTSGKAKYTLNCSYQESMSTGKQFVHILPTNWCSYSIFSYIPTFHLICNFKQNEGDSDKMSLIMKLVSFSGHPVSQQNETLTFTGVTKNQNVEEESMIAACSSSNLLKRFSEGRFSFCKGIGNCPNIENTLKSHGLLNGKC